MEKLYHTLICTECKYLIGNKESTINLDINRRYLQYIDYLLRSRWANLSFKFII